MKQTLSFCAGAITFAGVTYAAGFHATTLTFFAGILTAALLIAAALGSKARLRAAARLLNHMAGATTETPRRYSRRVRVSSRNRRTGLEGVAADVASALQNFGASRAAAIKAAQHATQELPAGSFEEVFRMALPLSKAPKMA